jgi:hypothetical protein
VLFLRQEIPRCRVIDRKIKDRLIVAPSGPIIDHHSSQGRVMTGMEIRILKLLTMQRRSPLTRRNSGPHNNTDLSRTEVQALCTRSRLFAQTLVVIVPLK